MMRAAPLLLAGVLLLGGCGAGGLAAVRRQAATDMACPASQLKVERAGRGAKGPTTSGVYYVTGCNQLRRYSVGCGIGGACGTPQGADILAIVRSQAGFDFKCDAKKVSVTRLNTDTFGARGCGRQASYIIACQGADCRVVQNSQSQ